MKSITTRHGLFSMIRGRLKMMLPLVALLAYIITKAQVQPPPYSFSTKTIQLAQPFHQIEVAGEVTVILSDNITDVLLLDGNKKDVESVRTSVRNGRLFINAEKKKTFEKLRIYVPVAKLSSLVINGDADVFSAGKLKIGDLKILLNGVSMLALDYDGKLKISAGEGYDLVEDRKAKQ